MAAADDYDIEFAPLPESRLADLFHVEHYFPMQNRPNNVSSMSSVAVRPTSASKALRARRKFSATSSGSASDFAAKDLV